MPKNPKVDDVHEAHLHWPKNILKTVRKTDRYKGCIGLALAALRRG
jgi:hypothetical protein